MTLFIYFYAFFALNVGLYVANKTKRQYNAQFPDHTGLKSIWWIAFIIATLLAPIAFVEQIYYKIKEKKHEKQKS